MVYRQYSVYHNRRLKKAGSCTSSQSNDAPDLPASVSFGKALSQWENEFDEDECIVELVIGGAKSYSYKTNKGKVVIKQKGITMDVANIDMINFETMKDMVLNQGVLKSAKRFTFATDPKTRDVVTKFLARSIRSTVNEKRTVFGYDTLPFGYVEKARRRQNEAGRQASKQNNEVFYYYRIDNNKTTFQSKYPKSRNLRDSL